MSVLVSSTMAVCAINPTITQFNHLDIKSLRYLGCVCNCEHETRLIRSRDIAAKRMSYDILQVVKSERYCTNFVSLRFHENRQVLYYNIRSNLFLYSAMQSLG